MGTSVDNGYPLRQVEEVPYRKRRTNYMKTPPLDILLRYIPQVVVPPEDFANTDDSEVVVNQQSPVIPPPASTSRSLSYPPPRPPQPLRKYSIHSSLLFSPYPFPLHPPITLLCFPLLDLLSLSRTHTSSSSLIQLCYVSCSALKTI